MLFYTKVGKFTEEEFETAFAQFKVNNKPLIFTYFKDADVRIGSINEDDMMSLWAFKKKLATLGHFTTVYKSTDDLKFQFNRQLDKLVAAGFIEFKTEKKARRPQRFRRRYLPPPCRCLSMVVGSCATQLMMKAIIGAIRCSNFPHSSLLLKA